MHGDTGTWTLGSLLIGQLVKSSCQVAQYTQLLELACTTLPMTQGATELVVCVVFVRLTLDLNINFQTRMYEHVQATTWSLLRSCMPK